VKEKLYTLSHDIDLLKEIDNNGSQFSSEEHAYVIEKEHADKFVSQESLISWYLSLNSKKLCALSFVIQYSYEKGYKNILSLGAGACVLEYLLKSALPHDSIVAACDFDSFFIEKAKKLLSNIIPIKFDFSKDDLQELKASNVDSFDLAISFGSLYVMDDPVFIQLLKKIKKIGVREIIDFHAGYMDLKSVLFNSFPFSFLQKSSILRKMLRKSPIERREYKGKFHGYTRSRSELRRIYNQAGLNVVKEKAVEPYKYVAILS
jgi:ubiquinone/menaquinone biosynthesis C-methylase UbiE